MELFPYWVGLFASSGNEQCRFFPVSGQVTENASCAVTYISMASSANLLVSATQVMPQQFSYKGLPKHPVGMWDKTSLGNYLILR